MLLKFGKDFQSIMGAHQNEFFIYFGGSNILVVII